jgi:thioredoxin
MHKRGAQVMDTRTFFERLKESPHPVVVDLWAPWCGPCRMVKPSLEKLSKEYEGRVDLWQINADESQELLRELKVYGIPTLISYDKGAEKVRYVGVKPYGELRSLFEALATGSVPVSTGLSTLNRIFRLVAGTIVLGIGWSMHYNWLLMIMGGILLFSAVYDRCPIWKAITTQFKKVIAK